MRWLSVVGAFRTGIAVCFVLVALVCSGAAGASAAGCGGSGAPAPNKSGNNALNAVAATSACNAWAVGSAASTVFLQSKTVVERWNGTAWKVQKSPSPSAFNELKGVAAVSPSKAWAVGFVINPANVDQTLVERWNGTAWKVQKSPNPSASGNELNGVAAVSSSDVWAVGFKGNGIKNKTLVERWNGASWKVQKTPSPSTTGFNELDGVAAVSSSDVWAVGFEGNGTKNKTLVERWNGAAWKVQKSPSPSTTGNSELYGVTALSPSNAWAVGYYDNGSGVPQTLVEHWNGTAWKVQKSLSPSTTDNELKGVAAVSPSKAWAVGYHKNGSGVPQTLVERWNGSAWKVQKNANPGGSTHLNELYGVAAVASSDVWAVGTYDKGTLGRTLVERWNGTAWNG